VSYTILLTLDRTWLTDPADPTTSPVAAGTRTSTPTAIVRSGTVRAFAGGRRQAAGNKARSRTRSVTFVGLDYAASLQLSETWLGRTLLYRSTLGERFFCAYFSVPSIVATGFSSLNDGRHFDVTVDLVEVDYDESAP